MNVVVLGLAVIGGLVVAVAVALLLGFGFLILRELLRQT